MNHTKKGIIVSFNPTLALKMPNYDTCAHFCETYRLKEWLSPFLQAFKGHDRDNHTGPNELKPAPKDNFTSPSMIWWLLGELKASQTFLLTRRGSSFEREEIEVDLMFWSFSQKLKRLHTS